MNVNATSSSSVFAAQSKALQLKNATENKQQPPPPPPPPANNSINASKGSIVNTTA